MKLEIIQKMEEVLANADISAVATQAKLLQREYEKAFAAEMEKARQDFIDEGGRSRDFIYTKTKEDEKIVELLEKYRKLKKQNDERLLQEQKKCLETKRQIVADINDLSKLEVNVGSAIKKLHELQTRWKDTGNVPSAFYREMQSEYSKAIEAFYYNLNIYKALQEHDLKKNFELKQLVIEKIKGLKNTSELKDLERRLRLLRNEWDEIGPVPQDKWEELKLNYKQALDDLNSLMKAQQEVLDQLKKDNYEKKNRLVEKVQAVLEKSLQTDNDWRKATEEVLKIQEEYRDTGAAERNSNEEVYRKFREQCDIFFEQKREFFAGWKEKQDEFRKVKSDLISQAELLMNQTDWKQVSEKVIRLQEKWKRTGSLGHEEPKYFNRFRKACNQFFEAKKVHFEQKEKSFNENVIVKESILNEIGSFSLSGDLNSDKDKLKEFQKKWSDAGLVPFKEKQRLNEAFFKQLDEWYDKINLDSSEREMMKFLGKIDRLKEMENADFLLKKEKDFIKKQIDQINSSVRTYENNMGFFKISKGKNSIMNDFELKIETEKNKIKAWEQKLKLINSALAK